MSKIHLVDGKKYVEVDRPARIGDKVLIVNAAGTYDKYFNGSVIEVQRILTEDITGVENDAVIAEGNESGFISAREYVVLEPLKPTLSELCAKCNPENRHEESGLLTADDIKGTPDKVIDMLANLARRVNSLEKQLAATQRNVETFAEQTEENSEDIRELDERTQIIDAINKYYAEGSR